jgi:hypothetical protein
MQNLTSWTEFDIGHPSTEPLWYALWSPKFDCFVLTHWDLSLVETTKLLCNTKIITQTVELDPELYQKNIIDNTCCHNWTIESPAQMQLNNSFMGSTPVLDPAVRGFPKVNVIETVARGTESEISQAQNWFIFVLHCLKKLRQSEIQDLAEHIFNLPNSKNIKKQVLSTLLLSEDLDLAQKQVDKLFSNYA